MTATAIQPTPTSARQNSRFQCVITPMCPVHPGQFNNPSMLNRTDIQELLDNQELLDAGHRRLLELVRRKPEFHPERFFDPHYLGNSTLLVASNYPAAKRYAFCCVPNERNPSGACKDHRFCPYCNYLFREQAVNTYVPAYHNGNWHFLTISFRGHLAFDSANASISLDYWDACKAALEQSVDSKLVKGAHWTEEIAILSFLPLRVMPHIHAIVDADTFGEEQIDQLNQTLTTRHREEKEPLELMPDIDVRPINSERSLLDRVRYLYKPINIAPKYEAAWTVAEDNNRARAWELNSEAREFAAGIFDVRKMRFRMYSKGTLNPKAKVFIGIKRADWEEQAEYLRTLQSQPPEYPDDPIESEEQTVVE